jgi:hypothetical protein
MEDFAIAAVFSVFFLEITNNSEFEISESAVNGLFGIESESTSMVEQKANRKA